MITRWSDFGFDDLDRNIASFDRLRREMDRVFGDYQRGLSRGGGRQGPRMALRDQGEQLVLVAEVPGLSDDEVDITLDQSNLTVRGERKLTAPEGYTTHRNERGQYRFARSFSLPCRVDADSASAVLEDGVLTLTMDKAPEVKPRQISVKVQ